MTIRSRILDFLEFKGLSRYRFYKLTDLSNGFLDKEGAINSDNCEKICNVFPEMNPEWLVLGKGEMIRTHKTGINTQHLSEVPVYKDDSQNPLAVEVLLDKIVELTTEIALLKMEIKELKKRRKIHLPPTEDDVRDSIAASPGVE